MRFKLPNLKKEGISEDIKRSQIKLRDGLFMSAKLDYSREGGKDTGSET